MEPILSRDYFGPIPHVPAVGIVEAEEKSVTLGFFLRAKMADLALAAMVVIAVSTVVLVINQWPR